MSALAEAAESQGETSTAEINSATVRTVTTGSVVAGYLDAGQWSACFGLSYRDLLLRDALLEQRIVREDGRELRQVTGAGGIAASRNKVTRAFLDETDGEFLWFIDTDMGFAPDTVDRLVVTAEAYGAVVGALCFAGLRRRSPSGGTMYAERFLIQPTVYDFIELPDEAGFRPRLDYPRNEVVRADATGAACLLIPRDVLESMRGTYGDVWFEPVALPQAGKGRRPRTFSEDMSFCLRLAAAGLPLYVDTSVKTTHEKGFVYLDEETFDRQQAAL